MAEKNRSNGQSSPSKLDRFLSRLGRTMTPPKMGIRSRRGVSPTRQLDMAVEGASADGPTRDGLLQERSVRADTLRKRERVAELRRQREQKAAGQRQRQARASAISPGAPADLATMAAAGSPLPHPGEMRGQSLDVRLGRAEPGAGLESDEFFNNPELNLLMQPLDPESAVADVEPVPPSQRAKQLGPRAAQATYSARGAAKTPVRGEFDFTINIPSTTLSPLVPGSMDRRQRSRTAVFMADSAVSIDADAGRRGMRPHTFTDGAGGAQKSSDVYQQIEAEMAENEVLKRELAQLDATVKALEQLVVASHSLRAVR
ncbi:hypothetical protein GGF43_000266 [Coemansia sp. RSA 2618]|nr:hypothetical protein GGF43_000266 [Coemansia sp. RSA 2618]